MMVQHVHLATPSRSGFSESLSQSLKAQASIRQSPAGQRCATEESVQPEQGVCTRYRERRVKAYLLWQITGPLEGNIVTGFSVLSGFLCSCASVSTARPVFKQVRVCES